MNGIQIRLGVPIPFQACGSVIYLYHSAADTCGACSAAPTVSRNANEKQMSECARK